MPARRWKSDEALRAASVSVMIGAEKARLFPAGGGQAARAVYPGRRVRQEDEMERYVPENKRGKKERRALALAQRGGWGAISPVTRAVPGKKHYNRKDTRWKRELPPSGGCFFAA